MLTNFNLWVIKILISTKIAKLNKGLWSILACRLYKVFEQVIFSNHVTKFVVSCFAVTTYYWMAEKLRCDCIDCGSICGSKLFSVYALDKQTFCHSNYYDLTSNHASKRWFSQQRHTINQHNKLLIIQQFIKLRLWNSTLAYYLHLYFTWYNK